jgi:hypothetical protein
MLNIELNKKNLRIAFWLIFCASILINFLNVNYDVFLTKLAIVLGVVNYVTDEVEYEDEPTDKPVIDV